MKQPLRNRNQKTFADIDLVILAGGLGTRLASVISDRPKALAEVGGRPFLDIVIEDLLGMGFERIILSVGHLKGQIKERYAAKGILFAEEEKPLGTGGGVKNAESFVQSDDLLVVNGDSWMAGGADLGAFLDFHKRKNALVTVALASPRNEKDYGAVFLDTDGKIVRFNEKGREEGEHFLSAGIYLMKKDIFAIMPSSPFSLETDFFPRLVGSSFYGFALDGEVVDIGTPERLHAAQETFRARLS
ncbi:MAG: sugar phosphate nucleotidyltransferase [bacterium]|nr:sugar phosphate nucleotidyltransferase [bacterium]